MNTSVVVTGEAPETDSEEEGGNNLVNNRPRITGCFTNWVM